MNQSNNEFVCPHCHSNNICKCSVIYKNGVTKHNYKSEISGTIGNNIFDQQYFSGEMETTGISMTDLARICSPPQKESDKTIPGTIAGLFLLPFVAGFIGIVILFVAHIVDNGIVGGITDFCENINENILSKFRLEEFTFEFILKSIFGWAITISVIYFGLKYQSERTKEVNDSYERRCKDYPYSYFCFKCGHRFIIR